ncbi:NUDIX hydrolase [Clostridium paraputrificum]|uniref:NUDIX hydrolase n=1 Tax=Clostridium TaxID=1485 RepID=UPI003D328932
MNIDNIKDRIKEMSPYINGWENMKRASIVIPLVEKGGEVCILFEVRAKRLNSQPGDICFPGGKIDKGEVPKETAIREFEEELGTKDIEIVNELDLLIRHDGMIIHPFLGIVNDINNIKISESEVDHIFYVPLNYLLSHDPLEVDSKIKIERSDNFPYHLIVNGENYKFKDGTYKSLFYRYEDYVIWGITAQMLRNFINMIK